MVTKQINVEALFFPFSHVIFKGIHTLHMYLGISAFAMIRSTLSIRTHLSSIKYV